MYIENYNCTSLCHSNRVRELSVTNDLDTFFQQLTLDQDICTISVESSTGKHTVVDGQALCLKAESDYPENSVLVTGDQDARGKALIICYTKDREAWGSQFHFVSIILKEQFNLKVGRVAHMMWCVL